MGNYKKCKQLIVCVSLFYCNFIACTKEIVVWTSSIVLLCSYRIWISYYKIHTGKTQTNESAVVDSDDDEMEVDKRWFTMDVNVIDVHH